MADKIHIVGVSGGEVRNSSVAGIVHGGMGNTTTAIHGPVTKQDFRGAQNPQSFSGQFSGNQQHFGSGNNTTGGESPARPVKGSPPIPPDELQTILRKRNCLETTLQAFADNNIDGYMFSDLDEEMLNDLNIDNKIERKRLKKIKDELSGQQH